MKYFRQCCQVPNDGISTSTSTNWLQHPLERVSCRSVGTASFRSVGTAAVHARALQVSGESMSEILPLNLSSVHFVHASGLILDRKWQLRNFCVLKTAGLAQFFGGIDLNLVDNQAMKSLRAESKGTPGRFTTRGPSKGYQSLVLGAIASFLEPFCGHLLLKVDKISQPLTFKIPPRRAWRGQCRRGLAPSSVSTILMTLFDEGMSNRECTTWRQRPLEADTILPSTR